MNDEYWWAVYFAGICAMQHHPKNNAQTDRSCISWCANQADHMLEEHHRRWPIETEEP